MAEKLKPCPFCGGEAYLHQNGSGYVSVGCGAGVYNCPVEPGVYNKEAQAVAAWNLRVDAARIEALEATLEPFAELGASYCEDDIARAVFAEAQRVYREDHDHFPLRSQWDGLSEDVRDGWRRMARAALKAAGEVTEKDL